MSEVLFKFKSDIEYSSHSLGALSEISVADLKQARTCAHARARFTRARTRARPLPLHSPTQRHHKTCARAVLIEACSPPP